MDGTWAVDGYLLFIRCARPVCLSLALRKHVAAILAAILLLSPSIAIAAPQYGSAVSLFKGGTAPVGVAVDSSGIVYWANYDTGQILSLAPGSSSPTTLLSGLNHPSGIAVDQSGNLFYDEYFAYTVSELPVGSTTPHVLFNAGTLVFFLTLDSQGDIFVVTGAGCNGQLSNVGEPDSIVEWNKATTSTSTIVSDSGIGGVFVTASNDLYYTTCAGAIKEIPSGSTTANVIVSGLSPITGVALDSSGDIFFTRYSSGVYNLAPGSTTPATIASSVGEHYYGLTIDSAGNLYYTDNLGGAVWEIPVSSTLPVPQFGTSSIGLVAALSFVVVVLLYKRESGPHITNN